MEALERDVSVLFPGAEAAIRRAAAAVPMAIASGALGAEIRRVLDARGSDAPLRRDRLRRGHAGQQAGARPVPAGRALLPRQLRDAPGSRECVAIEDSRWGLESARAAGLRTVGGHEQPTPATSSAKPI